MLELLAACIGYFIFGPIVLLALRILIAWQHRKEKGFDWKAEMQQRYAKAQRLRDLTKTQE